MPEAEAIYQKATSTRAARYRVRMLPLGDFYHDATKQPRCGLAAYKQAEAIDPQAITETATGRPRAAPKPSRRGLRSISKRLLNTSDGKILRRYYEGLVALGEKKIAKAVEALQTSN